MEGFDTPEPRKAQAWLEALTERDAGGHALPRFQCGARVHNPLRAKRFHGVSARNVHGHWFSLMGNITPFITNTYTINTLKSVPINPREALIGLMLYNPTYPSFSRNPCD